jgi:hypothetical protein
MGMKKHIDVKHATLVHKFCEEVNNITRGPSVQHLTKKWPIINPSIISIFFLSIDPFNKDN